MRVITAQQSYFYALASPDRAAVTSSEEQHALIQAQARQAREALSL
jgi:hypothetical protein